MKAKLVFSLILSFLLLGCASTPKEQIVKEVKYEKAKVPQALLKPCVPSQTLDYKNYTEDYNASRVVFLSEYIVVLLKDLSSCNNRIKAIKELVETE